MREAGLTHEQFVHDVRAAGGLYRDEAAVTVGHLLTGRGPDDLPQFCQQLIAFLSVGA